jgi:hypothetical protein
MTEMGGLATLIKRWQEDATFRAAVRADLDSAVESTGVQLDDATWAALRSVDWSLSDDELEARYGRPADQLGAIRP